MSSNLFLHSVVVKAGSAAEIVAVVAMTKLELAINLKRNLVSL